MTNAQKWYVEQELKKPEYEKIKDIPVLSAGAPFKAGGRNGATYYTDIPAGTLAIKKRCRFICISKYVICCKSKWGTSERMA